MDFVALFMKIWFSRKGDFSPFTVVFKVECAGKQIQVRGLGPPFLQLKLEF